MPSAKPKVPMQTPPLKALAAVLALLLCAWPLLAQKTQRLPRRLQTQAHNYMYPALSGDGQVITFWSDYSPSGKLTPFMAYRNGKSWTQPAPLTPLFKEGRDLVGGYALSYDGRAVYFTSNRGPGIGKFDLWVSYRGAQGWSAPQNLGLPVNSTGHEGCPSISPNNDMLFFVRCQQMEINNMEGCQMYVSYKQPNGRWGQAQALPANLNQGNPSAPKILQDGQTLFYSNNGQVYRSRRQPDGSWADPVPVTQIQQTSQYKHSHISVPAPGMVAYYTQFINNRSQMVMGILGPQSQPDPVMVFASPPTYGRTVPPIPGTLYIMDLDQQQRVYAQYLTEQQPAFYYVAPPGRYDASILPQAAGYFYAVTQTGSGYSASTSSLYTMSTQLTSIQPGVRFALPNLEFDEQPQPAADSQYELERLKSLMAQNAEFNWHFTIYEATDSLAEGPYVWPLQVQVGEVLFNDDDAKDPGYYKGQTLAISPQEIAGIDTVQALQSFSWQPQPGVTLRLRVLQAANQEAGPGWAKLMALKEALIQKGVPEEKLRFTNAGPVMLPFNKEEKRGTARQKPLVYLEIE